LPIVSRNDTIVGIYTIVYMQVLVTLKIDAPGLPQRIEQARRADTRSITEICQQAGISRPHWYRIEKGAYSLPIETLAKIESVLGVKLGVAIP
jgi:predicted transcriptional regulator